MAARGRGQAPPLRSILAGRCLPQQTSVGADAHIGPHLRATGQLRAGVGTRPYVQAPQNSPPETSPGSRGGLYGRPRAGTSPAPTGRSVPSGGKKGAAASAARAQGVKCILGRHRLCSGSRYSGRLEIRAAPDVKKTVPRRGRRGTGLLYSLTFSGSRPRLRTWQPWRRRPPWRRRWPGCRP